MASLIVRNLSDALVHSLKERAVRNDRSAEEEHRTILRESLLGKKTKKEKDLKELLWEMPEVGKDSDFARKSDRPRAVKL